jgi:hypothetical protein
MTAALRIGRVVGHLFTFVSGDATLLTAARAEGLSTATPFDHITSEEQWRGLAIMDWTQGGAAAQAP